MAEIRHQLPTDRQHFLGLTPSSFQSGKNNRKGNMTRHGHCSASPHRPVAELKRSDSNYELPQKSLKAESLGEFRYSACLSRKRSS
jgi:hypothetical protein